MAVGIARGRTLLVLALTAGLTAIFIRLAWIGDDAYITLRSVENLVTGEGLRWNTAERVQINTHPLWTFVLAAGRSLSGELYFTTIWTSITLSLLAVASVWRLCPTPASLLAMAAILACTRGFTEYATSGLETPLTYLLLVVFAATVTKDRTASRRWALTVLAALLVVANRLDLGLLCAPAVFASLRGVALRRVVGLGLLAASPFLAWLCFATVYYGTPLPVVAYSKALDHGISAASMAAQGLYYAWHTAIDDPVLMATMITGTIVGLWDRRLRPLAFGVVLHAAYVVKVGGDFMAGRFFVPPFLLAAILLARTLGRVSQRWSLLVAVLAPALMFCRGVPAWLRDPATDTIPTAPMELTRGIVDERRFYYCHLGLLAPGRRVPEFGSLARVWLAGRESGWLLLSGAVGLSGFGAGRSGHIVDPLLCDPLIARLPAIDPAHWRIGHILRRIPEGYWETLATGENRVRHAGLRRYVGALLTIVREPVFAAERLRTMGRMWRGEYDADLAAFVAEEYRKPPRVSIPAANVAILLEPGTYWFDEPRLQLVYEGGVAIDFGTAAPARSLRVQVVGLCEFRFRFLRNGVEIGIADGVPVAPATAPSSEAQMLRQVLGVREVLVTVPPGVERFDTVWVDLFGQSDKATGPAAIGGVVLGG